MLIFFRIVISASSDESNMWVTEGKGRRARVFFWVWVCARCFGSIGNRVTGGARMMGMWGKFLQMPSFCVCLDSRVLPKKSCE